MFSDTLTITVDAVDKSLVRINQDGYGSEYLLREDTGEFSLRIRSSSYVRGNGVKVSRHNAEFIHTLYGSDGNPPIIRKTYIIFEDDKGDTLASAKAVVNGFVGFLTDANVEKMLNWES